MTLQDNECKYVIKPLLPEDDDRRYCGKRTQDDQQYCPRHLHDVEDTKGEN